MLYVLFMGKVNKETTEIRDEWPIPGNGRREWHDLNCFHFKWCILCYQSQTALSNCSFNLEPLIDFTVLPFPLTNEAAWKRMAAAIWCQRQWMQNHGGSRRYGRPESSRLLSFFKTAEDCKQLFWANVVVETTKWLDNSFWRQACFYGWCHRRGDGISHAFISPGLHSPADTAREAGRNEGSHIAGEPCADPRAVTQLFLQRHSGAACHVGSVHVSVLAIFSQWSWYGTRK